MTLDTPFDLTATPTKNVIKVKRVLDALKETGLLLIAPLGGRVYEGSLNKSRSLLCHGPIRHHHHYHHHRHRHCGPPPSAIWTRRPDMFVCMTTQEKGVDIGEND